MTDLKNPPNESGVRRYRAGLGKVAGRMILLLTTTGRKTEKMHTVAVQYEKIGDQYFIGAGSGQKYDWYRNILVNPRVVVEIGSRRVNRKAEVVTGEEKIANFLAYRFKKHLLMVGMILKMDGGNFRLRCDELLEYARRIAVVSPAVDS